MNVTFFSNVLSRWAQLVNIFSRMFNLRTVMYIAKPRRSGLEWGDLLILFNRNNCSLSVGVFSFSLIWESIAEQFLTFVPHGGQTSWGERFSFLEDNEKFVFSRSANFGNVSPGRHNKHIFRAYPSTLLKIAELCFEILQFIRSAALSAYSLFRLLGAGTGFVGVLPLPLIFDPRLYILHFTIYTTFHREAMLKISFELLDTASRFEAKCRQ